MQERIKQTQVFTLQPKLTTHLVELSNAAADTLDKSLVHLVKLRASQLNGCAFCQYRHADEARRDGEQQNRLDILATWAEVNIFSEAERAALQWTENLTLFPLHKVDKQSFEQLEKHFNQQQIVDLSVTIATINAWNRIAVGFNFTPNFGTN